MRSTICNFSCNRTVAACLAVFALSSQGLAAETRDCRSIENNAERLACYDNVNSSSSEAPALPAAKQVEVPVVPVVTPAPAATSATPSPAAEPKATTPTPAAEPKATTPTPASEPQATGPAVLDDSIGKERIADRKGEEEDLMVTGHVTSCREDRSGKYRFYFDNGQIWLQKDNKHIPWRECDFDVTIEKDFFGYKLLPKGEKRTIRVSRIK